MTPALAVLLIAVALLALIVRVWCRRQYGPDEVLTFAERTRRRGGRTYFRCWRVA